MFRHEGRASGESRQDRWLAGYLAAVAGFVNAAGFVLAGTFTSHMSGNVTRAADDLAFGRPLSSASALALLLAFFAGAFLASTALEVRLFGRLPLTYGTLFLVEALMLAMFARLMPQAWRHEGNNLYDAESAFLCFAMGMQNSLVTRLSGAVVRTTHVTGIVTDLGIESARWFRYWRKRLSERLHFTLTVGATPTPRPHGPKFALLSTILVTFAFGSGVGAILAERFDRWAMIVPIAATSMAAMYAFFTGRELVTEGNRK